MLRHLAASLLVLFLTSAVVCRADDPAAKPAAPAGKLFELRIYKTHPGRLDALNQRFREHTNKLFVKHGMELIGYWTPTEGEEAQDTLIYILAYPNREAREASWKAFVNDPDWKAARDASEKDGKIVLKVDSKFLQATDYSPLK